MIIGRAIGQTNQEDLSVDHAVRIICDLRTVFEPPTEEQILLELQNSGFSSIAIGAAFLRANQQCPVPGMIAPRPETGFIVRKTQLAPAFVQQQAEQQQQQQQPQNGEAKFPWKVVGIAGALVVVLGTIYMVSRD